MPKSPDGQAVLARAVLASATDFAIITTDLQGTVTSWNAGAEALLGWSEADMIGQSASRFFTPEDNATGRVETEMQLARDQGRAEDVRWHMKKDGSRFWASGLMMRFENEETGEQIGYLKIVQDRTAHHLANEHTLATKRTDQLRLHLGEISERLSNVTDGDAMQAAAAEVIGHALGADRVGYGSVAADGETFTVPTDWTKAGFPSLAGVYRIDDYGLYAADLRNGETVVIDDVRQDHRTSTAAQSLSALGVGSLINHPIVEQGRTVAILYVNNAGARAWRADEVDFVCEAGERLRQASERRRAELEVRALNATLEQRVEESSAALRLYRDIVQSDGSPIVAFDRHLRITAFNKAHSDAYRRVYGIEQQVGDSLLEQFLPDQADVVREFMLRTLAGESFIVREAFGDPDLDKPMWQIAYNPLRDEHGSIIGGFHHALDISAELKAQDELARTQEALRQSQKMEAIGQLTGGVAHDFNNLLTVIRGSVDILKRDDLPAGRRERYLDAIGSTADRAAKLTAQLLAFARRQTLEPEVFDLVHRLDAVTDMLDSVTGTRVTITIDAPSEPCLIRADISQFETALVNLVVNARDAMNGNGVITVGLRCDVGMPAIRGHASAEGEFVSVSVNDTGAGIASGDLERIFEPFFTTKEVGRGTGLGLSQVFGFAKQSGGDVDVESTVGVGSTFTLYLPKADQHPETLTASTVPESSMRDHGRCVLVVEDNESVGQFATQALDDLGYKTAWAMNAEDALDRLGADGGGFDIVFSDVVMPGMGGVELAKRLALTLPNLPVVLASGYSHILSQEGTQGVELLRKPYSANQLSDVLHRRLMPVL